MLPSAEPAVAQDEAHDVTHGLFGKALHLVELFLVALALLFEGLGRVDVLVHVGAGRQLGDPALQARLLDVRLAAGTLAANVVPEGVDEVLHAQAGIDEALHLAHAVAIDVAPHPRCMVRHLVEHLAIGGREPGVVGEEVDVAEDVGHDQLLVHVGVVVEQVGVRGAGVDDHFVDLLQPVLVPLLHLEVLHAPAPVGVPHREAAVRRDHVDLVVVAHLEDGVAEVQAVAPGQRSDAELLVHQLGRKAAPGAEEVRVTTHLGPLS